MYIYIYIYIYMRVCILFINAKDKQCRKFVQYSINTESLNICN